VGGKNGGLWTSEDTTLRDESEGGKEKYIGGLSIWTRKDSLLLVLFFNQREGKATNSYTDTLVSVGERKGNCGVRGGYSGVTSLGGLCCARE